MPVRIRVLPYRQGSRSARVLADALGGRVLKLEGSRFIPRMGDLIINWGNTNPPANVATVHGDYTCLNDPNDIRRASNKLEFFQAVAAVNPELIPPFYTNQEDIPDDAFPIVCRTVLAGHSGAGIVIANQRNDLVPARLYVKYVRKQDEYRVHVGKTEPFERDSNETSIIAVQRKARREGFENPNWQVRNHHNGFVFVRGGVNPPQPVLDVAQQILRIVGLDFGAVDVIWNERQQRAYVLEVNTAPGLEGQTVTDYANYFRSVI